MTNGQETGATEAEARGPLAGLHIVELGGIGPGPMAAMLLADLGASVLRIERTEAVDLGVKRELRHHLLLRNRTPIALDLKDPASRDLVLDFVDRADALIEGFRPGVAERLGLGPDDCLARNPRLVYGRITGWGQDGPLASVAGHDINYISITGVLDAIGRCGQPPTVPLALVGDFAGGALYLATGILAALHEARTSGRGQVVDAAIVDGVAHMATAFFGLVAAGSWKPQRGTNVLDSGAPFYDVYQCRDGAWLSIGPIEARFHRRLLDALAFDAGEIAALGDHTDPATWPALRAALADRFRQRPRADWCETLAHEDVCCAPVLSFGEAPTHPHLRARGTFVEVDGVVQPAPAPRFSRSTTTRPSPPRPAGPDTLAEALRSWGLEK